MRAFAFISSWFLILSLYSQNIIPGNFSTFGIPEHACQGGCQTCCEVNRKIRPVKTLNRLNSWRKNALACLEKGYSVETCANAANVCFTVEEIPWGSMGPFGTWVNTFQLQQLLKTNCGDGICYQCCFTGDGCHSSFIGFPVINCNYNYGLNASAVGSTQVIDGEPGDPCLFTQQTCDHVAQCLKNLSPEEIVAINNDEDHIMKSPLALGNKRRWFMIKTGEVFNEFYNRYGNLGSQGLIVNDLPFDSLHQYSDSDITDFLTGRGGNGWKDEPDSEELEWTSSIFDSYNDDTTYIDPIASQFRATVQASVIRSIASIPNFVNRFNFIESRIWDESSKNAYLSAVSDPDEELLKSMTPLNLYVLQALSQSPYKVIEDYRLFSVPLPDEEAPVPNIYNGAYLGNAPITNIVSSSISSDGLNSFLITVEEIDSEEAIPLYAVWGDGTKDVYSFSPDQSNIEISHYYPDEGDYQLVVIAENNSGLRGVSAQRISTIAYDAVGETIPLLFYDVSEIRLNNVRISLGTGLGFDIDVTCKIIAEDYDEQRIEIGRSTPLRISSNPTTIVDIPYIKGDVPIGFKLSKISFEYSLSYYRGGRLMWEYINPINSWWSAESISIIIGGEKNRQNELIIDFSPDKIELVNIQTYFSEFIGDPMAFDYTDPEYTSSGELKIPFFYSNTEETIKGVNFELPFFISTELFLTSIIDEEYEWLEGNWIESKPNIFDNVMMTSTQEEENLYPDFSISVFPNPMGNSSIINIYLKNKEFVIVDLIDVLGRPVKSLSKKMMKSGLNQLPLQKEELVSGTYFVLVRINSGEYQTVPIVIK